jgi:hypothetical protein
MERQVVVPAQITLPAIETVPVFVNLRVVAE